MVCRKAKTRGWAFIRSSHVVDWNDPMDKMDLDTSLGRDGLGQISLTRRTWIDPTDNMNLKQSHGRDGRGQIPWTKLKIRCVSIRRLLIHVNRSNAPAHRFDIEIAAAGERRFEMTGKK